MIRLIEELSMSAWPSLQTHLYDGWVLRVSNGYTKRANSVNLRYQSQIDINKKIDYCKTFYQNLGLPVIFKVTSDSSLSFIDDKLKDLEYAKIDETSVRILNLASFSCNRNLTSEVSFKLTQEWIDEYIGSCKMEDYIERETLKSMLKNILGKTVFVTHKEGKKAVGFGYGVIDNGYVGIFDIYVEESFRGKGYGKYVINTILNESKQLGAESAYLQVVVGNSVAENLYNRFGFEESYRYWYRKL